MGLCDHLFFFSWQDEGHTEWVSCVRFSPNTNNPIIVSAGWDKLVKVVYTLEYSLLLNFQESGLEMATDTVTNVTKMV